MAFSNGKAQDDECGHGGELSPGGNVLQERAPAQADDIHVGEEEDEDQADEMRAREDDAEGGENYVILRDGRDDVAHVGGRGDGERRDGAAIGDAKEHPAVEEGDEVAVGFAQVNILAARVGKHGAEFGEGDAGAKRDRAAQDPDQKKQFRIGQRAGNIFRG